MITNKPTYHSKDKIIAKTQRTKIKLYGEKKKKKRIKEYAIHESNLKF